MAPYTREQVEEGVRETLRFFAPSEYHRGEKAITLDRRLSELGIDDSLTAYQFIMNLEDEFEGLHIPDHEAHEVLNTQEGDMASNRPPEYHATVSGVVAYICRKLQVPAAA